MDENTPNPKPSESVIRFTCDFCGFKVSVPQTYVGKKTECPQCKNLVVIPQLTPSPPTPPQDDKPILIKRDSVMPAETDRPFYPTTYRPHRMAPEPSADVPAQTPQPSKYKPVTLFDMLAFPFSISGVIHLLLFWFGPFLIIWLQGGLLMCCYGVPIAFSAYALLFSYFVYYIVDCIIAAANDERFAPDIFFEELPGVGDLLRRVVLFFGAMLICFGPPALFVVFFAVIFGQYSGQTSAYIFFLFYGIGLFFLPMFLLAVAMFDSATALNPFLIISSICSTIVSYCLRFLLFVLIALVMLVPSWYPDLILPAFGVAVYLLFIASFTLGRFCRRNEKKLNWEIKL